MKSSMFIKTEKTKVSSLKLVRQASCKYDHEEPAAYRNRGRLVHFTIEISKFEGKEEQVERELGKMEELLAAAGWDNDTCPTYDEGISCGFWVHPSEVEAFRNAYKIAKANLAAELAKPVEVIEEVPAAVPAANVEGMGHEALAEAIDAEAADVKSTRPIARGHVVRLIKRTIASYAKNDNPLEEVSTLYALASVKNYGIIGCRFAAKMAALIEETGSKAGNHQPERQLAIMEAMIEALAKGESLEPAIVKATAISF